jgi:hypothetical protein
MIEQTHSTKRIGMERSFKMIQPCSTQIFSCARKKGSIMCVWYCGEGFSKVFFNLKCIKMMFFHNVFYFWHNTSKPSKITYKNINLMFFQAKSNLKSRSYCSAKWALSKKWKRWKIDQKWLGLKLATLK